MPPAPAGQADTASALGARALQVAWGDAAAVAVQALFFVPIAIWRFVDVDEGTYLVASELVVRGSLPYVDFLYVQMPLLPYVYGAWTVVAGADWYAARLLSVVFATALGVLLFRHAEARFGRGLAILGVTLYASCGLVFAWYPTAKTYALSTLLLFAAYVVVARRPSRPLRWALGGVLLGLSVDTRLLFAAALPAFVWSAVRDERARQRMRAIGALGGGLVAGLLPSLVFLALDPGRFVFDNLEYHAAKNTAGLVGDLRQKAEIVANLLGIGTPDGGLPQILLLLLAAGVAAIGLRALGRSVPIPFWIAACVGVASLLPTPTYAQYLSVIVPFLVVGTLELVAEVRGRAGRSSLAARGLAPALAVPVAAYVLLGAADAHRYLARHADKRIDAVRATSAVVAEQTRSGEAVLSAWPGYLFGTGAVPVRGLETDFAPHAAAALTVAEAHRFRMATIEDVERMIRERRTRLLVYKPWEVPPPVPDWQRAIRGSDYRLLSRAGTAELYVAPGR